MPVGLWKVTNRLVAAGVFMAAMNPLKTGPADACLPAKAG